VIINANDGEIENNYFLYDTGNSRYPTTLIPNHKDLIEPFLPNMQIVAFLDIDSLLLFVGIIEFELADKARVKNFIIKVLNFPITYTSQLWSLSVDNHDNPFVSICGVNPNNPPSKTGYVVTFDSFLNQKKNDILFPAWNE